ncbi:MAG: M61 family metallopeptidase [Xanthomonadales bacterium]|nr:M61 family metallopeptidase [Xanthomonadales bacterium]ODU92615.1 MAG: peptidase M61 [Rhodanobacter sp. SCN 66-43]OJY85442.1 MAG: peptidase M61 [Xanthomonadales bacterium 66-474]
MPFLRRRSQLSVRFVAPLVLAVAGLAFAGAALADAADAHIPPAQDTPYPGTIRIHVDASDTRQGIFRVHETIPVQAGELTLLYPKWIPGDHSPDGPIDMLAGLKITASGKPLKWKRDKYDVYAFRVDVPQGVPEITVDFQFLSGRGKSSFIQMTDKMLSLEWNTVSLYPAGHYSRQIRVEPSVTFPSGWQFGTALERVDQGGPSQSGDTVTFKPTTFNTLVDSPIYAGKYFKRVDLDPGAKVPVHLDVFADAPKDLVMTPQQVQVHRNLVTQAYKLFDSHHYDHYDFLFSLSDQLSGNGLEHHQSSENGMGPDYFTHWDDGAPNRDLLAHEFTHSWNGKFRRPADLWTPNFNVPMGDSLLWVYEGQTQYWGFVLTARSGMWTPEQFRDALAMVAANYDRNRPGFQWRTLEDTTNDPTAAERGALPYRSWQMSEEYYSGGQMMWLAVDAKIRALTHDKESLDTFAKAFFGIDNGSFVTKTYTFDDVVNALNGVVKYDWAAFLDRYVDELEPPFTRGLEATGWKLVYTDQESPYEKQYDSQDESPRHIFNFTYSIGLTLTKDGGINDVRWNGPAFKAGIGSGGEVVAVNGQAFKAGVLKQAITAARDSKQPIELLIKYQGDYTTVPVDYHGGLQYPHLERIKGTPDYLSQIIAAKK